MNRHQRLFRKIALRLIFPVILMLVACGTFEVGLEPEVTPAITLSPPAVNTAEAAATTIPAEVMTREPATVDQSSVFAFASYLHPRWGYQIPVPNGAQIEQKEDGQQTMFTYTDESRTFYQQVEVFVPIPEDVGDSTEAFLRWASGESQAPIFPITIDNGAHQGAFLYAPAGTGSWCDELREQITAFVVQDQGYLIRIRSDAPDLCDAETIPETDLIINSIRLPEVVEAPSQELVEELDPPITAQSPSLQVAYVKNNNLWLWSEGGEPVALTKNGGVESLASSDDGQRIAFMRGGNIWVVHSDGSGERQLTSETDFETISLGPDLDPLINGIQPYQMAWRPGSHTLFFNTVPLFEGPGLILSNDLWSVEVDQGTPALLLPPGEGGKFSISPDGLALAVVKPGSIHLVDSDGQNSREIFTHTPILTYSEFQYYVEPAWQADSNALAVVVPPVDRVASPDQLSTVWYIDLDILSPRLMGNIPAVTHQMLFTKGLDRLLYLVGDASTMPASLQAALSEIGPDGIGEPSILPDMVEVIDSWSPDGQHFVFAPPYDGVPRRRIAALDGTSVGVGEQETAVFQVTWVDENRYLFLQHDGVRGWTIFLGELGSELLLPIDSVVGNPPYFATSN